jgi:hypothetical protein
MYNMVFAHYAHACIAYYCRVYNELWYNMHFFRLGGVKYASVLSQY